MLYLGMQATTPLPSGNRDVVVPRRHDWIAREQHIAIRAALMPAVLANFRVVSEFFRKVASLVMIRTTALARDHFLQRDNIGIDLAQNAKNAIGTNAPIQPTRFVDVVGDHTKTVRSVWMIRPGLECLNGVPPLPTIIR